MYMNHAGAIKSQKSSHPNIAFSNGAFKTFLRAGESRESAKATNCGKPKAISSQMATNGNQAAKSPIPTADRYSMVTDKGIDNAV